MLRSELASEKQRSAEYEASVRSIPHMRRSHIRWLWCACTGSGVHAQGRLSVQILQSARTCRFLVNELGADLIVSVLLIALHGFPSSRHFVAAGEEDGARAGDASSNERVVGVVETGRHRQRRRANRALQAGGQSRLWRAAMFAMIENPDPLFIGALLSCVSVVWIIAAHTTTTTPPPKQQPQRQPHHSYNPPSRRRYHNSHTMVIPPAVCVHCCRRCE